jgi:hypothetical protein
MGEDERGSSSSMIIFKGLLPSRDGRTGVKLRPRTWPWRLRVTSRENARKANKLEKDMGIQDLGDPYQLSWRWI